MIDIIYTALDWLWTIGTIVLAVVATWALWRDDEVTS